MKLSKNWREHKWEFIDWKIEYQKILICMILILPIPIELIEKVLEFIPRGNFINGIPTYISGKKNKITIDLRGMNRKDVSLNGIHFTNLNINYSKFVRCKFGSVQLKKTIIYGCTFEECIFKSASISGCQFLRCTFLECTLNSNDAYHKTTFSNCIMDGTRFNRLNMNFFKFIDCSMKKCQFRQSFMDNCNFMRCNNHRTLFHFRMNNCLFEECDLSASKISALDVIRLQCIGCNLESAILRDIDFRWANFEKSNLKNADFERSLFKFCSFRDNNLKGTNFSNTEFF